MKRAERQLKEENRVVEEMRKAHEKQIARERELQLRIEEDRRLNAAQNLIHEQENKKAYEEYKKEQKMISQLGKEELKRIESNERRQTIENERVHHEQQEQALEAHKQKQEEIEQARMIEQRNKEASIQQQEMKNKAAEMEAMQEQENIQKEIKAEHQLQQAREILAKFSSELKTFQHRHEKQVEEKIENDKVEAASAFETLSNAISAKIQKDEKKRNIEAADQHRRELQALKSEWQSIDEEH